MTTTEYGLVRHLSETAFEDAIERVTEALQTEGFGILTEIDVKATLKKKIDVDYRPYTILGACNPGLAHRGLESDAQLGLLLPCNVVVQAAGDGVTVSVMDPLVMSQVSDAPGLAEVAQEARERLERVMAAIT